MKIYNVTRIVDTSKNVLVETSSGTIIKLPSGCHSIHVLDMEEPSDNYIINLAIDLYDH